MDTGLIIERVVVFNGAQPTEKLVELFMLKVGQASKEVTVTVLKD